jgi:hypothetical protein
VKAASRSTSFHSSMLLRLDSLEESTELGEVNGF